MTAEILEQPVVFARILDHGLRAIDAVAALLVEHPPQFVLLAGRGTSDHAAEYAKYLIEVRLGIPCGLVSPSTVTAYESTMSLHDVLYIAVSQSGTSPDLVASLAAADAAGAVTVAVTNSPDSALATAARHHLDVLAGPELAVAATKSYTAELLTLFLLVESWGAGAAGRTAPGSFDALLAAADLLAGDATTPRALAGRLADRSRLIVTGRGYSQATAAEAALKIMETTYISAHAYSGADLMHGPVAMVDGDFPVVAVVPDGATAHSMLEVVGRLAATSAEVHVLTDLPVRLDGVNRVALPSGVDEALHPIVDVILLQRLALEMALSAGHDPDGPRGLLKATRTL